MAKTDIYQAVTDRILEALDKGTVPWRNPMLSQPGGFPMNLSTDKPYRGINVFLLGTTAMCMGYRSAYWLTFKQTKAMGGSVRKGEKGSPIVFFKHLAVDEEKPSGETKTKHIPMLKTYTVFNLEQVDGIDVPDIEPVDDHAAKPLEAIEDIIMGYQSPPFIRTGGSRAFYAPGTDTVRVPEAHDFEDVNAHASTLFHELVHSTGHSSRLARFECETNLDEYGSPAYGKEELIAECGAAFLCASVGILPATIDQQAAYIDGWRKQIKADKRLVISAAAAAQRAVDRILGISFDDAAEPPVKSETPATPEASTVENTGELHGDTHWRVPQPLIKRPSETPVKTSPNTGIEIEEIEVDPARLDGGRWDHAIEKRVGEGDISAAYSADTIAMKSRIRKPFNHHGGLWSCVGKQDRPEDKATIAKAYRVVPAATFDENATTYTEKTVDAEAARNDPKGFYHRIKVSYGGKPYVMSGPPCEFVPGVVMQPGLFG